MGRFLRIWILLFCIIGLVAFLKARYISESFQIISETDRVANKYKALIDAQNANVQKASSVLDAAKDAQTRINNTEIAELRSEIVNLNNELDPNRGPAPPIREASLMWNERLANQRYNSAISDRADEATIAARRAFNDRILAQIEDVKAQIKIKGDLIVTKQAASQKVVNDATAALKVEQDKLSAINAEFSTTRQAADAPTGARATACAELKNLRAQFIAKMAEVKVKMEDLSGTQIIGVSLKGENLRYQNRYGAVCDKLVNSTEGTGLTDVVKGKESGGGCIGLASQDNDLYNLVLPAYDITNTELFKEDITLTDQVQTINDTMAILQCDVSDIDYLVDKDIGSINVYEIKEKLNELSPYYISSGTLDYVTLYLVGNGLLDTALYSSTQILTEVNGTLKRAKVLSDKIFAV